VSCAKDVKSKIFYEVAISLGLGYLIAVTILYLWSQYSY